MCEAAKADEVMALKDLLRRGGSADSADQHDQTALYWAAVKGHREVVQVLLDAGATIDRASPQGMTPLMEAAKNGKPDVTAGLLVNGASTGVTNNFGQTALDWASGNLDCIAVLEAWAAGTHDEAKLLAVANRTVVQ